MSQEKRNLEMELEIKEQESQLLCTMQGKDSYNQVQLEKIEKARRENKKLERRITKKGLQT